MTVLEEIAEDVKNDLISSKGVDSVPVGDILADTLIIIQIISMIIGLIKNCRGTPTSAIETAKSPGIVSYIVALRVTSKVAPGRLSTRIPLVKSLFKVGSKLTVDKATQAFNAAA
jgi:hypothetical protein